MIDIHLGRSKSTDVNLKMRHILIAEDESLISLQLEELILDLGWEPIGPCTRVADVIKCVEHERLNGAFVDINLRGDSALPILPRLRALGVPFIITSGYDPALLPEDFGTCPRMPKPFDEYALRRLCVDTFSGGLPGS